MTNLVEMVDLVETKEKTDNAVLEMLITVQIDLERIKTAIESSFWDYKGLDPADLVKRLKALSETTEALFGALKTVTATVEAKA